MRITLKIAFVFLFLGLLIFKPTTSYAWHGGGGWHDGWHGHGYVGINVGWPGPYYYGYPYYPYYADPYYYPDYAIVSSSYQPVVVNGAAYYVNNGVYYIYTPSGYQVVATPVGAPATVVQTASVVANPPVTTVSPDTDDSFTVNIPNDKGGYSAVIIKRSGKGFTGPQGEFYAEFPKVSQLKVMYGK